MVTDLAVNQASESSLWVRVPPLQPFIEIIGLRVMPGAVEGKLEASTVRRDGGAPHTMHS